MTDGPQRRVTRGYVWGLMSMLAFASFSVVLAAWSLISLGTGTGPVQTSGVAFSSAAVSVLLSFIPFFGTCWAQAISLLRGRRALSWNLLLIVVLGTYLVWCLVGLSIGLDLQDTWLSPFALALALGWGTGLVLFWALLLRKIYTELPAPQWPWEKADDLGPDWAHTDHDPWDTPNGSREKGDE